MISKNRKINKMAPVFIFLIWFACMNTEAEEYNKVATELSLTEQLVYATVRIEAKLPNNRVNYGTGFFYEFAKRDSTYIPAIVTNKHVIKDAILGSFYMTFADSTGNPIHGSHEIIRIENFGNRWVGHPDPTIDLAAMPLAPLLRRAESMNVDFFFRTLGPNLIPDESSLRELSAVEDILMVGYPNGLWDKANNLPIYRSGITATHPAMDYNGRPDFMIDAACFPGSSGSPVFLFNKDIYREGKTAFFGDRIMLLGILWGGGHYKATGEFIIKEIPSRYDTTLVTSIPNNLGLVVKAEQLKELDDLFKARNP